MKNLLSLILLISALNASAQSDTTKRNVVDTLKKDLTTAPDTVPHLHSKTWTLIPPAAMIGYGIVSFYAKPLRHLDHYVYNESYKHDIVTNSHLENYFQYTPVILTYGLNLVGVHGKNTFLDRTILLAMSEGMSSLSLFAVKHATHRLRPNGSDRYSFPSGHTANAFAEAEFMSQELSGNSPLYGVLGYAFATTTGVFRIYHQDHWFSDVVAGAGLGMLSTKAAYLIYPYLRNRLTKSGRKKEENKDLQEELDKKQKQHSSIIMPMYQNGYAGLRFSAEF
jgi:membrane-associated phospholipid phosphatase